MSIARFLRPSNDKLTHEIYFPFNLEAPSIETKYLVVDGKRVLGGNNNVSGSLDDITTLNKLQFVGESGANLQVNSNLQLNKQMFFHENIQGVDRTDPNNHLPTFNVDIQSGNITSQQLQNIETAITQLQEFMNKVDSAFTIDNVNQTVVSSHDITFNGAFTHGGGQTGA